MRLPLGFGMFLIGLAMIAAAVLRLGGASGVSPARSVYHPRWEYTQNKQEYSTGHGYYQRRAERHGTLYQRTSGPH